MPQLPNLRHLRFLVALLEHQHFGKAAAACFVTQSTLSAGIRELESALGVSVAERTKRCVVITPSGRRIGEYARKLLKDAEALVQAANEEGLPMSGTFDLGVIPTIAPFLLPRLVPAIGRRFPRLRLNLREDTTQNLLERISDGRLDIALMAFPYETGALKTFMLFEDAYRYASANAPRSCQRVTASDLDAQNLLLLEHSHCLHSHALPLLEQAARSEGASFTSTSLHTLAAMVGEGLGATLLPDLAINGGILQGHDVVVKPLRDANARTIGLCWRNASARSESFSVFGEFLRGWALETIKPWSEA
ncbi:hydrogen peroxide-inducible genes activator [Dokdonella immobilis]|uniref:Transcriptional regulator, LysR family n=1 Tax=Dokdonella immobilis TaxID=578942 RepID=A0A1I4VSP1_9GAMM|nr:hydrogen peroxide-inducible genes activator [Dokdonella immobilis]SFN04321.1 transcriptional regulator, LysR family [Dokdonella immobilis]